MILINLLPHREEKRRRKKQAFFIGLAFAAAIGLLLAGLAYLVLLEMNAAQVARNTFLTAEIQRLEAQIKDIASLKSEIEALKARQKVVEDFQIDRNMPVHLLNELVAQTPEGVYLTSVRQEGQNVVLAGLSQSNERVSELLRNTAYNSPWLERPELVEIKVTTPNSQAREQRRLFEFSVKVLLKRPQDKQAAALPAGSAASAAVGAPGASAPARAPSASAS